MEQKKLNHYVVKKQIGHGRFGKVYYGINTLNDQPVAIKVVENLGRAKSEAVVMLQYGNSSYVPVLNDFFLLNKRAFLVMEYIDGTPIGGGFDTLGKKRDEKISVIITINILKGINHLHTNGYAHLDLHPKNILIKNDLKNTIKIIDFNKSKKLQAKYIKIDLQRAARICAYLINGSSPKHLSQLQLANKELESVLKNWDYPSATHFIDALKPFI